MSFLHLQSSAHCRHLKGKCDLVQNFDKILNFIKHESESECKEIAVNATRETQRIEAEFSKKQQEAYLNHINQGTKEIENRISQLSNLANEQVQKMLDAVKQDMLDEVLELTSKRLSAMPLNDYTELLKKLGVEEGCRPEHLVHQYRDELASTVISALFD